MRLHSVILTSVRIGAQFTPPLDSSIQFAPCRLKVSEFRAAWAA
jgi:hypothetical protein